MFLFREKKNKTKHYYVFGVSFTSSPPHSLADLRHSAADADTHHQLPAPKQSQQQAQHLMPFWIHLWKEKFRFISQRRVGESGLWSLRYTFPWTYFSSLVCDLLFPSVTDSLPDIACLCMPQCRHFGTLHCQQEAQFSAIQVGKEASSTELSFTSLL